MNDCFTPEDRRFVDERDRRVSEAQSADRLWRSIYDADNALNDLELAIEAETNVVKLMESIFSLDDATEKLARRKDQLLERVQAIRRAA